MKLRDKFWIWGQDAGSHHRSAGNATWKLPGVNKMEPVEGAEYLGIKNVCRVVMGGTPVPPFDAESEKMRFMSQVVWSSMGDSGSRRNDKASDLEEVLRQAEKFPNVSGSILDDFFISPEHNQGRVARYSLDYIKDMRDRLHDCKARPLGFWVVWYKRQLDWPGEKYLELFDVITYWNMSASAQLQEIDTHIDRVVKMTPGKRRLAGCYIWSYGEGKPLTIPQIKAECETYYNRIKKGDLDGIVFCSNCCADLNLEAVEWLRNWIKKVGGEEV
jgi:hypothetical protein